MEGRLTQQDLEKVGRMLSRHNITLRCEGEQAYCDMKHRVVVLPEIPPAGIADERLLGSIRFFLDHEVGHLVGESDTDRMTVFASRWGEAGRHILNSIEDVRVEALMSRLYRGCGINLGGQRMRLVGQVEARLKRGKVHPVKQVGMAIYRRGSGERSIMPYMDGDLIRRAIGDNTDDPLRIKTFGEWASSYEDAETLAEQVMQRIAKSKQDQDDPTEDQPQGGPGGAEAEGDEWQPGSGEGERSPNADAEGEGTPSEGGSEAGAGTGQGESDGSAEPQESCEDDGVERGQPGGGGDGAGTRSETAPDLPEDFEDFDDAGGIAEQAAGEIIASARNRFYGATGDLPQCKLYEPEMYPRYRKDSTLVSDMREAAKVGGGAARQRLVMALQSEGKVGWQGGRQRGAVDPSRLAALAAGTTDRVMRRRTIRPAKRTAVSLLLDASGSMEGGAACVAATVASATAMAMSLGGVDFEVGAFTGYSLPGGVSPEIRMVKRFGSRYDGDCHRRMAYYASNCDGSQTPLAASMFVMGSRLMARPADRRVLLVNTDGGASDRRYMRGTIKYLEARGVEVVLIGIYSDSVADYGHDKYVVVKRLSRLGRETFAALAKHLHIRGLAAA